MRLIIFLRLVRLGSLKSDNRLIITMISDNTYHVIPANEPHELDGVKCWCGPIAETVIKFGEVVGYVVIHNSKDGRQYIERGSVQ